METTNRAIEDAADYIGMMEKIMNGRGDDCRAAPRTEYETRTQRRTRERAEAKAKLKAAKESV